MTSSVTSIRTTPRTTTLNSDYVSNLSINEEGILWSNDLGDLAKDGPRGSSRCITIQILRTQAGDAWDSIDLGVSFTCPDIATWYVPPNSGAPPARFALFARFDGRDWLLASDEQIVDSQTTVQFTIQGMKLRQTIYALPFRIAGDITWAVQRTDTPAVPPVIFNEKTRLELCFMFNALEPNGPWESADEDKPTGVDFKYQYYIDLFRLFLPDQWELVDKFGTSTNINDQLLWYLDRSARVIWEMGLKPHPEYPQRSTVRLNPIRGQESFYLVPIPRVPQELFEPRYGGLFNLRRWMSGMYTYCSPYDLTALIQLACTIVRDKDGKEVLSSTWVTSTGNTSLGQSNWGFLNPGTFYGWPSYPQCTSPIFASDAGPSSVADENPSRTLPVEWHAWIEVKLPGNDKPTVLDVSQAFGEPNSLKLISGTQRREEYLQLKIDPARPSPERLPERKPQRENLDAVIFQSTPRTHRNRIGVMGISTLF